MARFGVSRRKNQAWRLRGKHSGSCFAEPNTIFARQTDVNKDRVWLQFGAKTQAHLALGGGSDDFYLAGVVRNNPARYSAANGSSSIITARIRIDMVYFNFVSSSKLGARPLGTALDARPIQRTLMQNGFARRFAPDFRTYAFPSRRAINGDHV